MHKLRQIFAFVAPYVKPYWGRIVAGVFFGILFGASNGLVLWATKTMLDRLVPPDVLPPDIATATTAQTAGNWFTETAASIQSNILDTLGPWLPMMGVELTTKQIIGGLLVFPLLVGLRGSSKFLGAYCLAWASERVVNDLRVTVFRNLSRLSIPFFNRSSTGDLITRINGDALLLQSCLASGVGHLVAEPVAIVSVFTGLCLIDWQLTLSILVLFPICIIPIVHFGKKARKATGKRVAANIDQSSLAVEMFSGMRVIKAFGLENARVDRFRELSQQLIRQTMKTVRSREIVGPLVETISMIGIGALILYVVHTARSIPDLVVFFTGVIMFYTPIRKLARWHVRIEEASVGVHRLMDILDEKPDILDRTDARPVTGFAQGIEFDGISFAYEDEPVLSQLVLSIPKGTKLGIVGESGSGKSTLINLLFRFHDPDSGAVRLDGHDLRDLSIKGFREQMALVSQEVVLFDLTVAENIALGQTDCTREQVEAAARHAHAHEFIIALPEGYDTRIGERGVTLSGGQRQRLAIARAFVRDAPILVLDEATAALDSKAEGEVQAAIDRLSKNRTVLCVAHRLSTLRSMDRIIVLSRGGIIEEGGFDEMLAKEGVFSGLARAQGITA
ncbi:MAG: ABC transporter ATP-binding protein [Verrucomicrobiota bacterium]|jgi:subfamily B ATP-binding cassette protein MsbA|nr:ABC transporter ATP-binding protein [Verrucomicrobiota bacterium]